MMIQIGNIIRLSILILLASCAPTTLEDLRYEGKALTNKLANELSSIESKEELQKAVPHLKKRFNKMADLLIESKNFTFETCEPSFESEELFAQLARLYELPGGRELIELAQAQAVQKLQAAGADLRD